VVVGDNDGGGTFTQGVGENLRRTGVADTIRLFPGRECGGLHNAIIRLNGFVRNRGAA
jgi:hypothetical protein